MRVLVIGCGSIGRRHIRLLREMGVEVHGYDSNPEALFALKDIEGVLVNPPATPLESYLRHGFDGAIIATPNHLHYQPAIDALKAGCAVLVEKPLAHTEAQAGLIDLCARDHALPLLVGYCLRYHPGLLCLKSMLDDGKIGRPLHATIHFGRYLPDWHPGQDYRRWYSAHKEQGGGVLLDASHEIDYACWLFGEPVSVSATVRNTGALDIDTEDLADMTLGFESGMQAHIHLDYLDRRKQRWCRVVGDRVSHTCDLTRKNYMVPAEQPDAWVLEEFEPDDMYRAELRHFLAVIKGDEQPRVTGEDGLRVLRVVEAAKRSSQEGRSVLL